jgi:hypothetical protein
VAANDVARGPVKFRLFLVFIRRRRRGGSLGGLFATRTANRTPEERWLLLLFGRRSDRRRSRTFYAFYTFCTFRRGRRLGLRAGILTETAVADIPVRTVVGTLVAIPAAIPALGLMISAIVAVLPAIIAVAIVPARPVAIVTVAAIAAEILTITSVLAIVVVTLVAVVVPRLAVFVAVLIIEIARLLRIRLLPFVPLRLLLSLDAELVAVILTELVAFAIGTAKRMRAGGAVAECRIHPALLRHLFAVAQDDAVIVLGVLKIIFRQHRIAGRERVTSQRNVFLGNVRRRATDFHIRPRTLEAAHQRVLGFAVVVVVVPTATAAVLLSLPHGLPFTIVDILKATRAHQRWAT